MSTKKNGQLLAGMNIKLKAILEGLFHFITKLIGLGLKIIGKKTGGLTNKKMSSEGEIFSLPPYEDIDAWADRIFYSWGCNCFPAPTADKNKDPKDCKFTWIDHWREFQHREMTVEEHETFKRNGEYRKRNGLAIIAGPIWRGSNKGLWLGFAEADNEAGKNALLRIFNYDSIEEMAQDFVVEQRKNAPDRIHVYYLCRSPMGNLDSLASTHAKEIEENKVPGIENKCERPGLAYSTPSFHSTGLRYEYIPGSVTIPKRILEEHEVFECEQRIEEICQEYGISYLDNNHKIPMTTLLDPDFRIQQGNNRHKAVLKVGMHYLLKLGDRWEALEKTKQWNLIHCEPPLSEDKYVDLPRTFQWSEKYVEGIRRKEEAEKEQRQEAKDSKKEKAISLATKLVEEQDIIWFHDEYQVAYMRIKIANHYEIYRITKKDRKLRLFLTKLYYDATNGHTLKDDELNEVIRKLEANGIFSGNLRKLHLRKCWGIKGIDEATYQEQFDRNICFYDMCSPNWTCIMVDGNNDTWELLPFHPENITFFRYQQLPQAIPNRNYPKDIYDQWLDMAHINDENDRILFKVWFVTAYIPDQPHPMLIPHGPPGGTKSSFCKHLQIVIDSYAGEPLILPTEKKELSQQAHHRALLIYDNVEYEIPKWLSDLLCQLITSANVSKRQLYSDDTDFAYVLMRSVVLNGLQIPKLKPDALDRTIVIHFDRISEEERKKQTEVDDWFRSQVPNILGKTFDVLARSLKIYKTMPDLKRKPRMADFASRGASVARAIAELEGTDADAMEKKFLDAYEDIMERQNIDVVEADSVASALIRWHNEMLKAGKEGADSTKYRNEKKIGYAPGDLLYKLTSRAEQMGFDTKDKEWPKKPNMFTKALRPLTPDIRHGYKIDIHIFRDTKGEHTTKNSTWIEISEVTGGDGNDGDKGKQPGDNGSSGEKQNSFTKPSPPSPPSPPAENAGTNSTKNGGDGGGGGGDISTSISTEIQAQSGGGGGGGDTLAKTILFLSETAMVDSQQASLLPLVKEDSVTLDLEWDNRPDADDKLVQFNFKDWQGNKWVLSAERDFNGSESRLLDAVEDTVRNYSIVFTYYGKSATSDLGIWHKRCMADSKISPVKVRGKRGEYSKLDLINHRGLPIQDIDICQVYEKEIIENFLENIYISNELDEVAKAVIGRRKLQGVSGEHIASAPLDVQIKYGTQDADITHDLATAKNCLVLSILEEIGSMVGMNLIEMCHSGPTRWWSSLFRNKMGAKPSPNSIKSKGKGDLKGGDVEKIKQVKEYRHVAIFDFKGQYPSIIIRFNISFDTVCCDCCRDDPEAKVHTGLPDIDAKGYWICRKKKGALPIAIEKLVTLRDEYKKLKKKAEEAGNQALANEYEIKQLACKLMANSGFGVFGEPFFDFGDVRVASLITGYGRSKVGKLKEKIESTYSGLENIYRDTDSAFVIGIKNPPEINKDHPIVQKIIQDCNAPESEGGLGIPLEYQKCYSKIIIAAPKNYMGLNADTGRLEVKGLVGKKRNQCELVRDAFEQEREYWRNDSSNDITEKHVKSVVKSLDEKAVGPEKLKEKSTLHQDPKTGYLKKPTCPQKVLGLKYHKQMGQSITFYLKEKRSDEDYYFTEDIQEIGYSCYKERLKTALRPILTVRGYDDKQINSLLRIPVPISKKKKEKKKK
jgi:DNA polymerase elongation subunit (family B)